jgi:hypothetical protein
MASRSCRHLLSDPRNDRSRSRRPSDVQRLGVHALVQAVLEHRAGPLPEDGDAAQAGLAQGALDLRPAAVALAVDALLAVPQAIAGATEDLDRRAGAPVASGAFVDTLTAPAHEDVVGLDHLRAGVVAVVRRERFVSKTSNPRGASARAIDASARVRSSSPSR